MHQTVNTAKHLKHNKDLFASISVSLYVMSGFKEIKLQSMLKGKKNVKTQ